MAWELLPSPTPARPSCAQAPARMPTQGSIPGCAAAVGVAAARSQTTGAGQACWGMAVGEAAGRSKEPNHRRGGWVSAGQERGGAGAGGGAEHANEGGDRISAAHLLQGDGRGSYKENPARLGPAPCLWPCISSLQPALHPASRLSPPRTLLPLASHRAHCAAADCVSRRCGGSGAGKRRRERAAAIRRWARPPHTGKVCRPVSRYGAASATRPAVRACSICVGDQNARPTFHWAE